MKSFRLKLRGRVIVAAALTLLCAGSVFLLYDAFTFRQFLGSVLQEQAKVIATQTSVAVSFGDLGSAEQILASLSSSRYINTVAICSDARAPLVQHRAAKRSAPIQRPCEQSELSSQAELTLDADKPRHTVIIHGSYAPLIARTTRFAWVLAIFVLLGIILALILSSQVRTRTIAMFDTIKQRDDALEAARDALSLQVVALEKERDRAETLAKSKSQFLANMSHEIRTPLNGILGTAELLLDTQLDPNQDSLAQTLHSSGTALLTIVNDILDLSKLEAGRMSLSQGRLDLWALLQDIDTLFSPVARRKEVELLHEIDSSVPRWVQGDAQRLRQILSNLLGNALKFTHEGKIQVRLRSLALPGGPVLEFSVHDSGIGIPKERLSMVFERFEQAEGGTTRSYGGTGLGLAIVRALVEQMGGTIHVESVVGEGSVFSFHIPQKRAQAPALTPPPETKRSTPFRCASARVLLCEDNRVNRMVATRMLERLGCQVTHAENGVIALKHMKESTFDLVFMDCHMPQMDGYTATLKAREAKVQTPILALTANVLPDNTQRCAESGMNAVLSKPINKRKLEEALLEHLPAPQAAERSTTA